MKNKHTYKNQIEDIYPDLVIETAVSLPGGQYNDVILVNDQIVFRFAKNKKAITTLQREIAILNHVQSHLTLPVPDPIFSFTDTDEVGKAFMGYPKIVGKPLWRETLAAITDSAARERIARQLGAFLQELHAIPVAGIPFPLTQEDTSAGWQDIYQRIRAKLWEFMRPDARKDVEALFARFFGEIEADAFTPTLRHGDFGTGNLLHDPQKGAITGVLDFGFTGLGDPAIDLAGLANSDEDIFRRCQELFPEMAAGAHRVRFYRRAFVLEEALYGVEYNDAEAFAAGIADFS